MTSISLKLCSRKDKCVHPEGPWLPATTEYFPINKKLKSGLDSWCRECYKSYGRERYKNDEQYRVQLRIARVKRESSPEYQAKAKAERRTEAYRTASRERARRRWADPEYRAQKRREYAESAELREYRSRWYKNPANRERIREYDRRRAHNSKRLEDRRINKHKRRAQQRNLPNMFTASDWQHALDYFHGCCAVCGRQLNDLFGDRTAAMDHWIPLSSPDCPGTIPANIVPLCHGLDGCNNSKNDKDAYEWLVWKFGKRKASKILKRIQDYFEWIACQSDDE